MLRRVWWMGSLHWRPPSSFLPTPSTKAGQLQWSPSCAPDPRARRLLCCAARLERREKEQAIHGRFAQRIEQGLEKLGRRLEHARRRLDRGKLERQISRLLERNARAAGRYLIDLRANPSRPARLVLTWSPRPHGA